MKRLKRIISILVLLPLILVIGCGSGKDADSNVPEQETADTEMMAEAGTDTTDGTSRAASTETASASYRDGTFKAQTEPDYEGYFAKAEVTIKDGKIIGVDWIIYDSNRNDRPFDEKYEEVFAGNETYVEQSRKDWKGSRGYGPMLVETQDADKVDAISGATWTNKKFKEIVTKALDEAKK